MIPSSAWVLHKSKDISLPPFPDKEIKDLLVPYSENIIELLIPHLHSGNLVSSTALIPLDNAHNATPQYFHRPHVYADGREPPNTPVYRKPDFQHD